MSQFPVAPKKPVTLSHHGHSREDNYAWMRDENWQQVMRDPAVLNADIRAYLEAENAHTEDFFEGEKELVSALTAEMRGRIKEDDSTVPARDGAFSYFLRYAEGGQHPIYCRKPAEGDGEETILLHGDREAETESYFRIADCEHSPDHRLIAYTVDLNGSEKFRLRIRNAETGQDGAEDIPECSGDVAWANDGKTIFYTQLDDNHRPWRIMRHAVGADPSGDIAVYEEPDSGFYVGLGKSQSGRFIEIHAHDHATSEVHLIDADAPDTGTRTVQPREPGLEYDIAHWGEKLFIRTNADDAVDFKIVETGLETTGRENWRDVVPHEPGRLIRAMLEFEDYLVRLERMDGLPRIVVRRLADGYEHEIPFEEEIYELGLMPGYEFRTPTLRFTYSSMATPARVYDYDMGTRERTLRKEQEIPSGHDPGDYSVQRLFAESHDGAKVPVSILRRKDTPLDGTAPLLLYGYGSYGLSIPASFAANRLSLVDRGFIYAIAHIRGGTERGYQWYLDGKLDKKMNSFLDLIAAGEMLIRKDHCRAGRIAIHGGSAGGLLVGAASNLRPDLWGAVVAEVPFVDVLTTILDDSLPLTPPEWTEWGNPITDKDTYETIRAYSPYDNVAAKDYPPMFVLAGLTDPRVTYWEPAKWVAKLRELKTDDNPLLLRVNMEAGHGGASGRFDRLEEVALVYAFALKVLGN